MVFIQQLVSDAFIQQLVSDAIGSFQLAAKCLQKFVECGCIFMQQLPILAGAAGVAIQQQAIASKLPRLAVSFLTSTLPCYPMHPPSSQHTLCPSPPPPPSHP